MTVPVLAFFNNKGGVGKTSLVYHLAHMYADRGVRVVTADLDPQASLTSSFLDENRLELLYPLDHHPETVYGCLEPLKRGVGDVSNPHLEPINPRLSLIVGDMALSLFEDQLSEVWPKCMDGDERAFRVTSGFWRILQAGAAAHQADVILVDLGPNLGAINRAALIASDFVVVPLGPDLFSLQGLQNLGPALRRWRHEWSDRISRNPAGDLPLPAGSIKPLGYVILRHSIRLDRPVKAFEKWIARIPAAYLESVLGELGTPAPSVESDANCIAKLRDYRSLMPLAQEARLPMFFLKPVHGALGAHSNAARSAYQDFLGVAVKIAERAGIKSP